ncbi:hypothetical protein AQ490_04110 [Wenjunlia vitaminophila]|uniref:DUF742 domain-containing protein n=1 Tax=Wenjunlia vitaminophila TaxID=76728 RepID=A0A0T6LQT6_WENVI|nr:hypothetical protein AQ490_04110 [Wenjunlia vitaminophila]
MTSRGRGRRPRLYAATGGRSSTARTSVLTMDTLITAAGDDQGLPSEWRAVLDLCRPPRALAVAELAARMGWRLTPMTRLLGVLLERGLIHHRLPLSPAETCNVVLLTRIRECLAKQL